VKSVQSYYKKLTAFFTDSYNEFKNVTWPTKDQTIRLTGYVLGVSLGVALFVWGVDLLIKELLSAILIQ
jgi:preprotein translocase subunit SecE